MPVIVHSSPGRVTSVRVSAALLLRNGKLVAVKIGDLINPGDHQFTWVVTNGRDTTKDSTVSVAPVNHIIGGNRFGTPIPFEIAAQSIDPNAAASLLVTISGVPARAAFSAGTDLSTARWSFSAAQLAELAFLPPAGFAGSVALTVTASTVEPGTGQLQTIAQQTSVVIDATGNSVMGTQVANLLLGTPANDYMQAYDGGDVVFGAGGNDILHGDAGNDTLEGDAGNDTLNGSLSADTLRGADGNERLFGGIGNDSLAGGAGSDVFAWALADQGSAGVPATDIIIDFDAAARPLGGDVLDLRDLLAGETTAGTAPGNLEQFLDFDTTSSPGDTLIRISSSGAFGAGVCNVGAEDQRIDLQGIDLRSAGVFGLNAAASDNDVIAQPLQRGKLTADGPWRLTGFAPRHGLARGGAGAGPPRRTQRRLSTAAAQARVEPRLAVRLQAAFPNT